MLLDKPILLTGIQRSGTTFVGRVLAGSHSVGRIDEPFSLQYGVRGVSEWYPYARAGSIGDPLRLWDPILKGRAVYRRPEIPLQKKAFTHRWGRKLLKSRFNIGYQLYRFNPFLTQVVVKDPFLSFLSERLHREKGVRVVVMIRHPAAFVASCRRCGFHFDLHCLEKQKQLMNDHLGTVIGDLDTEKLSEIEQAAWAWRCIYSVLFKFIHSFLTP